VVELDEAFLCALICAMKQSEILHLHQLLVTIRHLQDHCHDGNVAHNDLEACV
jgi:hypothetical protein